MKTLQNYNCNTLILTSILNLNFTNYLLTLSILLLGKESMDELKAEPMSRRREMRPC
jgi:hypothetical protein